MCNVVGAVTDKDDDYCAYYTMTVVDVRSLVRPTRSHKHTGTYSYTQAKGYLFHAMIYPKSLYSIGHKIPTD